MTVTFVRVHNYFNTLKYFIQKSYPVIHLQGSSQIMVIHSMNCRQDWTATATG